MAKKFLDEIDLGDDALRSAVVEFMPYSFALVNKVSKKFFETERRYNYTTPKTFLELIKLYKNVLGKKRKETQVILRMMMMLHLQLLAVHSVPSYWSCHP